MKAKALFGSYFLGHSFWEGHNFFLNLWVVLFIILSPLVTDPKVYVSKKLS